jgi:hypothetical protein
MKSQAAFTYRFVAGPKIMSGDYATSEQEEVSNADESENEGEVKGL